MHLPRYEVLFNIKQICTYNDIAFLETYCVRSTLGQLEENLFDRSSPERNYRDVFLFLELSKGQEIDNFVIFLDRNL